MRNDITHPKASVLPVVVPHVIVHDFIEAVADVVNSEHVHVAPTIETWKFVIQNNHFHHKHTQ